METIELRVLLRPLFRWWWLIAVATLIAAASSFIYTFLQPSVYESRTTLFVGSAIKEPNPNSNQVFLAQQLAQTYADIALRKPIQQATMDALGVQALPYYTVQVAPNTQVVEIKVVDQDPVFARDFAAMLSQQLILQGPAGQAEHNRQLFVDTQLEKLQVSIIETEDEIIQKQQELANLFSAREIANVENQIDALDKKLTTMQSNYAALLATTQRGAANALSVLEPASLPDAPLSSRLLVNVLIAAIIGFAFAAGGAYLIEYLDDSIKDGEDAQQLFGAPTLATVPDIVAEHDADKLIMLSNRPHPAAEAYRMLRTNLQFASVDRSLRLLLVTSPSPEDGKSLTAANLSAAYTRAGKRVILVDADLHRPAQQRFFQVMNNIGLTLSLFDPQSTVEDLLQESTVPGLRVLSAGPLPPNPAEMLSSKRMQEILCDLRDLADIVIIDSPPISAVSDAMILSTYVDAVLLVTRATKTSRTVAKKTLQALQQVRAYIVGIVYNGVDEFDNNYTYDYTYHYYNTESSGQDAEVVPYSNGQPSHTTSSYPNGYHATNGHVAEVDPDDQHLANNSTGKR
ncbi:MAG: polysaccharide biosynthesis tyrosine autokinase [Caldilineaceae bacterium]